MQCHLSPTPSLVEDCGLGILASNPFIWPPHYDLILTQKTYSQVKRGRFKKKIAQHRFINCLPLLLWNNVKGNLRKKRFIFFLQSENRVHHCREGLRVGTQRTAHTESSEGRQRDQHCHTFWVFLVQSGTPVHEISNPTFRVGHFTSISPTKKVICMCTRRFVS